MSGWAEGSLANLIAEVRGEGSLRDLARVTDVSLSTLSRLERGHKPDVDVLARLCRCFGWSADSMLRLVRGEDRR